MDELQKGRDGWRSLWRWWIEEFLDGFAVQEMTSDEIGDRVQADASGKHGLLSDSDQQEGDQGRDDLKLDGILRGTQELLDPESATADRRRRRTRLPAGPGWRRSRSSAAPLAGRGDRTGCHASRDRPPDRATTGPRKAAHRPSQRTAPKSSDAGLGSAHDGLPPDDRTANAAGLSADCDRPYSDGAWFGFPLLSRTFGNLRNQQNPSHAARPGNSLPDSSGRDPAISLCRGRCADHVRA